jgi:hypothetical protein
MLLANNRFGAVKMKPLQSKHIGVRIKHTYPVILITITQQHSHFKADERILPRCWEQCTFWQNSLTEITIFY